MLPGLGSLQRAGGEVPRPQRQFQPHTPKRRGGAEKDGEEDVAKVLRTRRGGRIRAERLQKVREFVVLNSFFFFFFFLHEV